MRTPNRGLGPAHVKEAFRPKVAELPEYLSGNDKPLICLSIVHHKSLFRSNMSSHYLHDITSK